MRLGRALATGVAEEKPGSNEEDPQLAADIAELETSVPEEVPVAR
jgi:hypothetical protein